MALILGVILAIKNYKIGKYLLLLSGIIATVGIFIPIGYSFRLGYLCRCPIYLVASSVYITPFLVLIGGIPFMKTPNKSDCGFTLRCGIPPN